MSFESLHRHCASLPGATIDIKWGTQECHCVGTRMFAIFTVEQGRVRALSFKCDPERFLELTDVPGLVPAPYLARAHWVQIRDPRALPLGQARALLARSHALVLARLTRRERDAVARSDETRACSHYVHKRVARPKRPGARRAGESGRPPGEPVATKRMAFSAATRRERAAWGATLRCPPRADTRSALRRAPRLAPHATRSRLRT